MTQGLVLAWRELMREAVTMPNGVRTLSTTFRYILEVRPDIDTRTPCSRASTPPTIRRSIRSPSAS